MVDLGIMFRRENAPEALREYVQQVEALGYDEVWIVEDCFYASGVASVAAALAYTERIKVGLGIVPSVARNAAFTAMEFATLARMFPQRFLPGIGHGVGDWMKQIGAFPKSQLAALEEVSLAVRAIMRGETVTMQGKHVQLENVQLEFPPEHVPPVQLGVRQIKSLQVSGRAADGTLLAEGAAPAYIRWAREQIAIGQAQAGHPDTPHRVTVYVWTFVADDTASARQQLRGIIGADLPYIKSRLEPLGIVAELERLIKDAGDTFVDVYPDEWLAQLTVSGTAQDCAESVQRFIDAGADSVVFVVPQAHESAQMQRLAEEVLPLFR